MLSQMTGLELIALILVGAGGTGGIIGLVKWLMVKFEHASDKPRQEFLAREEAIREAAQSEARQARQDFRAALTEVVSAHKEQGGQIAEALKGVELSNQTLAEVTAGLSGEFRMAADIRRRNGKGDA